jgi:hypothetical protein
VFERDIGVNAKLLVWPQMLDAMANLQKIPLSVHSVAVNGVKRIQMEAKNQLNTRFDAFEIAKFLKIIKI